MKQFAHILLVLMVALASKAQSSQFLFMGIPLEGDISTFNLEMLKNNFILGNPGQNNGTNIYKGAFEGDSAYVFVLYEPQTDFVYRAVAQISCPSKELIFEKYKALRDDIEQKYVHGEGVKVLETKKEKFDSLMHGRAKTPYNWKTVTRQNGYEIITFMIPDRTGTVFVVANGLMRFMLNGK